MLFQEPFKPTQRRQSLSSCTGLSDCAPRGHLTASYALGCVSFANLISRYCCLTLVSPGSSCASPTMASCSVAAPSTPCALFSAEQTSVKLRLLSGVNSLIFHPLRICLIQALAKLSLKSAFKSIDDHSL
jgi:hypothetical protein